MQRLIIVALLSLLASHPLLAQQDDTQRQKTPIDRVQVKGSASQYWRGLQSILPASGQTIGVDGVGPLADSLASHSAINYQGQGGLLQTLSIRGLARWRTQTLLEGVPLYTERRAGASLSFLPPAFAAKARVIPGAASTQLGSGALGGGLDVSLAMSGPDSLGLSLSSAGDTGLHYRKALDATQLLLSVRHHGNAEAANNTPLNTGFKQQAIALGHDFDAGVFSRAWSLYSRGYDIGKSSSDYPHVRPTHYPEDRHWLGKLNWTLGELDGAVFWHDASLTTRIDRVAGQGTLAEASALTTGGHLGGDAGLRLGQLHWRLEALSRTKVTSREYALGADPQPTGGQQTLNAREQNLALAGDLSRALGPWHLALGARVDRRWQHSNSASIAATFVSGFAGLARPLWPGWQTHLYLSSGFRAPALTERFYTGTSPRGLTIGNSHLEGERSLSIQWGILASGPRWHGSLALFHQGIRDYIERVQLAPDTLSYQNLQRARISGLEYAGQMTIAPDWQLDLNGQWLRGVNGDNQPLVDIAPHNHSLTLTRRVGDWRAYWRWQLRQAKRWVTEGERPLERVSIHQLGLQGALTPHWQLYMTLSNGGNAAYYVSADNKAPWAPGRMLRLALEYRFDGR